MTAALSNICDNVFPLPWKLLNYAGNSSLVHLETTPIISPSRTTILHLRIPFFLLKLIGFEPCTILRVLHTFRKSFACASLNFCILKDIEFYPAFDSKMIEENFNFGENINCWKFITIRECKSPCYVRTRILWVSKS